MRKPGIFRAVFVPAAVFLVLAGAFLGLWWSISTRDRAILRRQTRVTAEQAAARLEDALALRLALVDQIRHEWLASPFETRAAFTRRSLALQREFPGYLAVNWIDPDGIIRWAVPREPNRAAENRDLHQHPFAAPFFIAAEHTGRTQVTPPIELYQGGTGLAAYFPIIAADGTHLGYLNAVFRLAPLIRSTLREEILGNYAVLVAAGDRIAFSSGDAEGRLSSLGAAASFRVGGQPWELRLVPGPRLLRQERPLLATALLLLGIALAGSSAWLARLALLRHAALEASERKFRDLFESISDLVFFLDASGVLLDINESGARLLGAASRDEIVGRNLVREIFPDPGQRRALAARLAREGMVRGLEVQVRSLDGRPILARFFGSVIRDPDGRVTGYRGIVRDITEHKLLEERMARMERMEGLSSLAGGVAHDFNNILATIQHRTSLLALRSDSKELREHVDAIEASVRMAASLTAQLLTFARGDVRREGSSDLNGVVRSTLEILGGTVPAGISIETELEDGLPPVVGTEVQLQQVVLNLCLNARDAMQAGGRLRIRTALVMEAGPAPAGEESSTVGPWARLEVQDEGTGMDPATRERAFDPFFTTKGPGEGTGLGLAVVYGTVTGLGGHVDLDSEPGRGTTITIHLPVAPPPPTPSGGQPVSAGPAVGTGRTVLVVDDDGAVRASLTMVLEELGYTAAEADSGEEALRILGESRHRIGAVILDMTMPGLDGVETFAGLRRIDPGLPIIVSTGYSRSAGAASLVEAGAVCVLHKPYRIRDLLAALREALDGGRPSPA